MAEGKKSFVLYTDLIHSVEHLTNEQAGGLFKHILSYVNDHNPETDNVVIKLAFEPIKQQLKRDLKKWKRTRNGRSDAGRKGGIKSGEARRSNNEANEAIASNSKQKEANEAVNVSVNVNDNVTVINNKYIRPDENYKLDLPENKINSAIEYLTLTKNIKANSGLVNSLWTVFKQKNFTGENSYNSEAKIFSHFFESLKFEKINGTHKQTLSSQKPGTADDQNESAERW